MLAVARLGQTLGYAWRGNRHFGPELFHSASTVSQEFTSINKPATNHALTAIMGDFIARDSLTTNTGMIERNKQVQVQYIAKHAYFQPPLSITQGKASTDGAELHWWAGKIKHCCLRKAQGGAVEYCTNATNKTT